MRFERGLKVSDALEIGEGSNAIPVVSIEVHPLFIRAHPIIKGEVALENIPEQTMTIAQGEKFMKNLLKHEMDENLFFEMWPQLDSIDEGEIVQFEIRFIADRNSKLSKNLTGDLEYKPVLALSDLREMLIRLNNEYYHIPAVNKSKPLKFFIGHLCLKGKKVSIDIESQAL